MRGYESWNSRNTPPSIPDSPRFDRRDLLSDDMSSGRFRFCRELAAKIVTVGFQHYNKPSLEYHNPVRGVMMSNSSMSVYALDMQAIRSTFSLPDDATEFDIQQAAGTFLFGNVKIDDEKSPSTERGYDGIIRRIDRDGPESGLEFAKKRISADLDAACKWLKRKQAEPSSNDLKTAGDELTFSMLPHNLGVALHPSTGDNKKYDKTAISMAGLVKILGAVEVARIFTQNGLPVPVAAQTEEEADEYGDRNPDDTIDETRESLGLGLDDDVIDAEWLPK